ncbi:hypothetical protein ACHWQZ_G016503 [Mnemiopsis leidyi]
MAASTPRTRVGPWGFLLIVEFADIKLAEVETLALSSSPDPPSSYSHFVDDSCGAFKDKNLPLLPQLPKRRPQLHHGTSTGRLPTPTSTPSTPPVPSIPPRTVSSDSLNSRPTIFALLNSELRKARHVCLLNGAPPQQITTIMIHADGEDYSVVYFCSSNESLNTGPREYNHSADSLVEEKKTLITSLKRMATDQQLSSTQNILTLDFK